MSTDERVREIRERVRRYEEEGHVIALGASAHTDVPFLLAALEEARAERDALLKVLRPFAEHGEAMEGCCETDQWSEVEAPDGEWTHWLAVQHFFDARDAHPEHGDTNNE